MAKTIKLNHITKIEGHASLNLKVDKGIIKKCELSSTEGARYFEGILLKKRFYEAHEISSRICGICSCAHTICATMAIEKALDIDVTEQTRKWRELITLGERIRSHATHLYFLALPDYLGFESVLSMLPKYKKEIERAIRMIKTGNMMIRTIGGRDLHPVSNAIGGMLKLPHQKDIQELIKQLEACQQDAEETVTLFNQLHRQKFERHVDYLSLATPKQYAVLEGFLKSEKVIFKQQAFHDHLQEAHKEYSTANFIFKDGHPYRVGALARFNNNHGNLSSRAKALVKKSHLKLPSHNPFLNNLAQAIEIVHCIDHSLALLNELPLESEKTPHFKDIPIQEGHGIAAIEVPRGVLWHEYTINKEGIITYANIVTPTVQNLQPMEDDIRAIVPQLLHLRKEKIVLEIEKLIRSYDPCFSCSTHFLKVKWL